LLEKRLGERPRSCAAKGGGELGEPTALADTSFRKGELKTGGHESSGRASALGPTTRRGETRLRGRRKTGRIQNQKPWPDRRRGTQGPKKVVNLVKTETREQKVSFTNGKNGRKRRITRQNGREFHVARSLDWNVNQQNQVHLIFAP